MRLHPLVPLLLVSCASSPAGFHWRPETPISWPPGEELPRIEVLFAYHGVADSTRERGFLRRLAEVFTGSPQIGMVAPYGMDTTPGGDLLIADTGQGVVHRLSLATADHEVYRGTERHPLVTPIGVAVVPDGRFFVTDSTTCRITVFSREGDRLESFGSPDEIARPTGIVYDHVSNRLLLLDTLSGRIMAYGLDGTLLGVFGNRGEEPGEFNFPTAIAIDPQGLIYVVDSMNFRIQILSNDLEPITAFGIAGSGPGAFTKPKGVALDSEGNIYVVDSMFDNVQVFDDEGRLLLTFCSGGSGLGRLYLPTAIAIDDRNRIFVADTGNARIQVFQFQGRTP